MKQTRREILHIKYKTSPLSPQQPVNYLRKTKTPVQAGRAEAKNKLRWVKDEVITAALVFNQSRVPHQNNRTDT